MLNVLWKSKIKIKLNRLRLKNRWHFLLKEVVAFQLTSDDLDEYLNMK